MNIMSDSQIGTDNAIYLYTLLAILYVLLRCIWFKNSLVKASK